MPGHGSCRFEYLSSWCGSYLYSPVTLPSPNLGAALEREMMMSPEWLADGFCPNERNEIDSAHFAGV